MKNINALDVVALLVDIPERGLVAGQVGTAVEILDDEVFEVEFCDNNGKTYDSLALHADRLMPLYYSPVAA
ncbi:MAG: DUF4926 domain-containing protein [Desulfarculaceae bacterium]|nr:DUF4926 domain-containing protein [Desulfarculaceae bacterium]